VRAFLAKIVEKNPHPNPLPEYRERGKDKPAVSSPSGH
jgi:hypothetical protein